MEQTQSAVSLQGVIEQVGQEKGIDKAILIEATEQAILTAAKRAFGENRELEAKFNLETGSVDLFQYMTVVEEVDLVDQEISLEDAKKYGLEAEVGEELGFQIFYLPEDKKKAADQDKQYGDLLGIQQARQSFGRIAAQTAKQVIMQRVRDAERDRIFNEYKSRKGELVSGVVRRFERGSNIIVDLGRGVEAILPAREQTPRENYRPGDRIVALLKDIDREARGPQLVLSRSDSGLLVGLFETEVPEIYEGIVRIVAAAREPGARSKIAVSSRDNDVDPVGACVGMKGSRVQAVVLELRGEKIDIVPWDRDPARFVCNAIAPAEVVRVVIDETGHSMELVVPDAKLSLAIGRRGQNVRLASQLSGWKLDIISESRFKQIEEEAMHLLARLGGDEHVARNLYRAGFRSLDEFVEADPRELAAVEGISEDAIEALKQLAQKENELYRKERLVAAKSLSEMPSDLDKLRYVQGVTARISDVLRQHGYGQVEAIYDQDDVDQLALTTRLSAEQVRAIKENVERFVDEEWPEIESAIQANRKNAVAEKAAAEAKQAEETAKSAAANAEAAKASAAEAAKTPDSGANQEKEATESETPQVPTGGA